MFRESTLFRRLFWANSRDILTDFCLTVFSAVINYAQPYFLNLILQEIADQPDKSKRSKAYVYAIMMFLTSVLKAESDLQHLWFGRRAATRAKTEVMASIYDKALRRKDFSGIVKKDGADEKVDEDDDGKKKAGADTGKIVNLMTSGGFDLGCP